MTDTTHASDDPDLSSWPYLRLRSEHRTLTELERQDRVLKNKLTHKRYIAAWEIAYGRTEEKRRADIRAIEDVFKARGLSI